MTQREFIEQIAQYAIKIAPKYGIVVVSPLIAQACKESAFGTSGKAKYHNYFGLKYRDGRVPVASGYFTDTSAEQNKDGSYVNLPNSTKWFKFDTMEDGVEGYLQFINVPNYASLKGETDPQQYLNKIKAAGYATSLTYVTSCMNDYIKKYNLTVYDMQLNNQSQVGGNKKMYKVALDAGHGSNTAGKRHPDGYREHYSNTYVAYYVDQILTQNGFETLKISWDDKDATDDPDVALSTRQAQIKAAKCDISVSFHANAFGDGNSYNNANGIETFYHSNSSLINDSAKLASCVQNELIKGTPQTNRGVKRSALAMCNAVTMGVQGAILIELAFMTNQKESELLKSDPYLQESAREVAQGIFNYFGVSGNINVPLNSVLNESNTPPVKPQPVPSNPTPAPNEVSFKTGDSFTLKDTTIYTSSNIATGVKRSGTYYIWSNEVVNNRVRITNTKNRVGVQGQVTGWVNVSDLGAEAPATNSGSNTNPTVPTVTESIELVAGKSIKLTNATLYTSSNIKTGVKRTGTYYIWSNEVVNGRIRITNAKNRVGVSGQVSGWIDVNILGVTTTGTIVNPTPATNIVAGNTVKLTNITIYASSNATSGVKKTGTYYIWSNEVVNNRVRITNAKNRVGVQGQVTGWVNVKDI